MAGPTLRQAQDRLNLNLRPCLPAGRLPRDPSSLPSFAGQAGEGATAQWLFEKRFVSEALPLSYDPTRQ